MGCLLLLVLAFGKEGRQPHFETFHFILVSLGAWAEPD
jgi:hypothetical protein